MTPADWDSLAHSLAVHLASLEDDEIFSLYVITGGLDEFGDNDDPRYVQFCAHGSGSMRCEVISNEFLPEELHYSTEDIVVLARAGWQLPESMVHDGIDSGSPNIYMDVQTMLIDFAADAAVTVFRDVWRVSEIGTDKASLRGPRAFTWIAKS